MYIYMYIYTGIIFIMAPVICTQNGFWVYMWCEENMSTFRVAHLHLPLALCLLLPQSPLVVLGSLFLRCSVLVPGSPKLSPAVQDHNNSCWWARGRVRAEHSYPPHYEVIRRSNTYAPRTVGRACEKCQKCKVTTYALCTCTYFYTCMYVYMYMRMQY